VKVGVADAAGEHADDPLLATTGRRDVALLEFERRVEGAEDDCANGTYLLKPGLVASSVPTRPLR
jgi:hypothetical protein